jgi:hypothetical protein
MRWPARIALAVLPPACSDLRIHRQADTATTEAHAPGPRAETLAGHSRSVGGLATSSDCRPRSPGGCHFGRQEPGAAEEVGVPTGRNAHRRAR